jgi:DNA invertase Pin-like site-specific DNA recombinase
MPRKPTPDQFDAIYARVSSTSQDTASQEPDLKRIETASDLPCVWFRDKFSGKTLDRPGWNRLWQAALDGKVRRVIVWRLDRLGRMTIDLLKLIQEMKSRGVKLVLVREGCIVDDESPAGKMFITMLAGFAEYEREVRAERQTAGIATAKANGVKFGRPKTTDSNPAKRVKVTPEQEILIRRLKSEGSGVTAIAKATGLSRPTIYAVLGQP